MDEIGKMRRGNAREDRSIKGTDRGMSVSRATVRKVLRPAEPGVDRLPVAEPLRQGAALAAAFHDLR